MNFKIRLAIYFILLAGLSVFVWQRFFVDDFPLPIGGETTTETITVIDGEVVEEHDDSSMSRAGDETEFSGTNTSPSSVVSKRDIMVTDGVKHSIPLEDIVSGGPPKDGIPPIDDPKFISAPDAESFLDDDDPGIAFSRGNIHRFYPYQILVWHEIVNDTIGGQRTLITYCPLCLTGVVFDPVVKGERVEFGTSGKLWQSNLVMYDRKTDSLWPQVLGEAVVGEMTGTVLKILSSDQVRFGDWKKLFPQGQVLSRDTGAFRAYGTSPYGSYFNVTDLSLSLVSGIDDRLPNDAFVFGIVINGKAKAYDTAAVKAKGEVRDTFEGTQMVLRHDSELDVVRMVKVLPDGSEERINPISGFWFSWAAAHPQTELYK